VGIIAAWSTAFCLGTVFQCGTNWRLNFAPIGMFLTECSNTLDMLSAFAATDILTDFIIMFMPVPMIWSLQMAVKKKLAITGMFTVGLFVVGAGIARLYVYLITSYEKESNPDFIADFTLFLLWSDIEANVAVVSASLPTLLPVITKSVDGWGFIERSRLSRHLISSLRSRNTSSKVSASTNSLASEKWAPLSSGSISDPLPIHGPRGHGDPRHETRITAASPHAEHGNDLNHLERIVVHQSIRQSEDEWGRA
jgi:hypothetical protein